jgi:hypothetical protein
LHRIAFHTAGVCNVIDQGRDLLGLRAPSMQIRA